MTVTIQLSEKQKQLINCIADGLTQKQIAGQMKMTEANVKKIVCQLIELFDCKNSSGLVDFAWRNGIRKM